MASTYSDLKIELIGTGDDPGTWGVTTNTNLGTAIEEAIAGSATVTFAGSDVTITLTNTNATQSARHLRLNCSGSTSGATNLILGSGCQIEKPYLINNGCAHAITVKNTTGSGVAVPAGKTMWVYNNGVNVVDAVTHLSSLTLSSALPASSGGTGLTSLGTGVATWLGTPSSANLAAAVTDETGSGALVFATSPTLVTPTLGVATATSVNKVAITAPATGSTLTIADGKTATVSNTLTFTGTDSSSVAFGAGGTVAYTGGTLGQFASTTSAQLAGVISDETGSGALVFANTPTLVTPVLGTPTSGNLSNCTADGTDQVGFKNIPQNSQSANYTLVLGDAGKHVFHPSSDNNTRTFTIPAASSVAYPIGTAITFINLAAAAVTIAITTDTMYFSPSGGTGSRTLAQYGSATAIKVSGLSSSGVWVISGSGLT
jgi:hypothetical protein